MEDWAMAEQAIRPLTGYIGGKWHLRKVIAPLIDRTKHTCYVEPFMGMCNVFLGRQVRPRVEVLNDRNNEVATLFRVVQRHPEELIRTISMQVSARAEYARLYATPPAILTDVERAARFLVLRRLTFSGQDAYTAGFATSRSRNKALAVNEMTRRIVALNTRLDRVTIENLDYLDVLRQYDGPDTLFYLDPPYWGCTHLYPNGGFVQRDFQTFATAVVAIEGRWIVSLNDTPEVRDLFKGAAFRQVATRYNANVGKGSAAATELLISSDERLLRPT